MNSFAGLDNEDAISEILTLQDEVNRLNSELFEARQSQADGEAANQKSRYDDLKQLAESGIEKDRQIEKLKRDLADLIDEVEMLRLNGSHDSYDSPNSKNGGASPRKLKQEVDALKDVNEMLRKQVELTKRDLSESQDKLRQEAERSAMELEAFAETLQGVDELRQAAESMSRELKWYKEKEKKEKKRYAEVKLQTLNEVSGTDRMDGALRKLDGEPEPTDFFGKIKSSLAGAPPLHKMESFLNLSQHGKPPSGEKTHRRRRRRRGSSDKSVMSAIF